MRTVVCDVETERLENPEHIWCAVCIDVDTGEEHVFRHVTAATEDFLRFASGVSCWIGHNFISFDGPVLRRLIFPGIPLESVVDTLVLSRLLDFKRHGGHSLEAWGERLGIKKEGLDVDFSRYSEDLVSRCVSDCRINHRLYLEFLPYLKSDRWAKAIRLEHDLQIICQDMKENGFCFDVDKAREVWDTISKELHVLNLDIQRAFPPRSKLIREIIPRATKFGTLSRTDFRWHPDGDLSDYSEGNPFSRLEFVAFNPGSPSQVVERLNEAGWKPTEKTKGHLIAEKEKRPNLEKFKLTGWKVSEKNLETLPEDAPEGARKLAQWIALRARQSDLEEWIGHTKPDGRIRGDFTGIGSWTQRMAHSHPNQGNIYRPFFLDKGKNPTSVESIKLRYNGVLRSLWIAAPGKYLVGVDAEGIQLRVLAEYMQDERFIQAVVSGDPHSLNKEALGAPCRSRDDAKTFIYAWVLGAGIPKVATILHCTIPEAKRSNESFLEYYPGLKLLRKGRIREDAARGYFEGFDGRWVKIKGEDADQREYFCLGGYLQNGEKQIMAYACRKWRHDLRNIKGWRQVDFVHDEWQTEVDDYELGVHVGKVQAESIAWAGKELGLRTPFSGSVLNKNKELAVGVNWLITH